MGKKIIGFVLMMALLLSALAADASWTWVDTSNKFPGSAGTLVTLDTSDKTLQAEIGFTTSAPSSDGYLTNLSNLVSTDGVFLNVFDSTTGKAWNNSTYVTPSSSSLIKPTSESKLYASWLIQSGESLNIYLYADGKLKKNGTGDGIIGWKVYNSATPNTIYVDCTSGSSEVGISTENPPASFSGPYIERHVPTGKNDSGNDDFKNYGSVELVVVSDSVWKKAAAKYTANLYMVIESVGEGN